MPSGLRALSTPPDLTCKPRSFSRRIPSYSVIPARTFRCDGPTARSFLSQARRTRHAQPIRRLWMTVPLHMRPCWFGFKAPTRPCCPEPCAAPTRSAIARRSSTRLSEKAESFISSTTRYIAGRLLASISSYSTLCCTSTICWRRFCSKAPGNQMDLVDLIDMEPGEAGVSQLPADFLDRIRCVKRRDEIPLQDRGDVAGVFTHEPDGRIVVRRPE